MLTVLTYQVLPCPNVPAGLPRQQLLVLSPVWRGPSLTISYPDGEEYLLTGRHRTGRPCDLRVFWTRHQSRAPAVCLVIGGAGGLRETRLPAGLKKGVGRPFLCLAETLIPPEVLAVIGPPPPPERPLLPG
jgi:hypothetical protein